MTNLKKLTRRNTKKIQKLQVKGDFNIAISILNATLKKSVGYTNVAAFGKKETITRDAKARFPNVKVKTNQVRRKATIGDFKPSKRYSRADIRQSLDSANRLLSKIKTPLTGTHQVYLFNPNYKVKVNGSKINVYRLLNSCGCGSVITINDTNQKTQFNFWFWVDDGKDSKKDDECLKAAIQGKLCTADGGGSAFFCRQITISGPQCAAYPTCKIKDGCSTWTSKCVDKDRKPCVCNKNKDKTDQCDVAATKLIASKS